MKKIIKSITNALTKVQENNRGVATLRFDVVKRAVERGEFEKIICEYHMTDDYVRDSVDDFGRGEKSKESLLQYFGWLKPSCWVQVREKDGKRYYEISVEFHSNLAYSVIVPMA